MNPSTSLRTSTITVSATHARNNFFDLLNQVAAGKRIVIERDKKEVAVLEQKTTKTDWEGLLKASRKVHGILRDADPNDNPLRKKAAWKSLGKWDKGLLKKKK